MLTDTPYIYRDKEALNNNHTQASWEELRKVCQI